MMGSNAHYRPDIDGLRAIAVVPVVLYHAGVSVMSGGYVGVDVFFVISGYLITQILVRDLSRQDFSLLRFYERRIRRIAPALIVVLAFVLITGFFVLMPDELGDLSRTLIAAVLFVSNFLFRKESGYFDASSETRPLLHTWSLAVEEQFYVFFPIFLFAAWRLAGPRLARALIAVGLVTSCGLAIWKMGTKPDAAFYLIPFRAWELAVGAMLALVPKWRASDVTLQVASFIGVIAIIASVTLYTSATPFPGFAAMPPVIGAALIIYSGKKCIVNRVLSVKPLRFIGLISYSLYLWHWPLIVFSSLLSFRPLSALQTTLIVALSFALATLSWRYIEQPFRATGTLVRTRRGAFIGAAGSFAVAAFLALLFLQSGGLPSRLPQSAQRIAAASLDRNDMAGCASGPLIDGARQMCEIGATNAPPTVLIWGDSHARGWRSGFHQLLDDAGVAGILVSLPGCPIAFGLERIDRYSRCSEHNHELREYLRQSDLRSVIIVAS